MVGLRRIRLQDNLSCISMSHNLGDVVCERIHHVAKMQIAGGLRPIAPQRKPSMAATTLGVNNSTARLHEPHRRPYSVED